jgi:hypothetical protein
MRVPVATRRTGMPCLGPKPWVEIHGYACARRYATQTDAVFGTETVD